jgi:hypothetical protein
MRLDGLVQFGVWIYFVDHAVPGVACVVDDDVDFAVAEVCGLLDERVEVCVVEHVSWGGDGLAAGLVDAVCDALCFVCCGVSERGVLIAILGLYHILDCEIIQGRDATTDLHRYRSQRP